MSTPASRSGLIGEESARAGWTETGRRLANTPMPLPQPQQTLLGADRSCRVIPFGAAHRAQQHGVSGLAGFQGFTGQRRTELVDRAAADGMFAILDGVPAARDHCIQYPDGAFNNFWTDAVPRE